MANDVKTMAGQRTGERSLMIKNAERVGQELTRW